MTVFPGLEKNPWYKRYVKGIIMVLTGVVILGTYWTDGPSWLPSLAAVAGAFLGILSPNAPKYKVPEKS